MNEKITLSIPVEFDDEGYIEKECPSCMFLFKVHNTNLSGKSKEDRVFCPLCGKEDALNKFWTTAQIEESKRQTIEYAKQMFLSQISKSFKSMANDFNRKSKSNSFFSIQMNVKEHKMRNVIVPIGIEKEMQLKITCENCDTKFAVIGSAFFCPICGKNSIKNTFYDSLRKIESKINNIEVIKMSIPNIDEAELIARSLIESSLSDCVVSFQRYCEEQYKIKSKGSKVKFNVFQRIDEGSNEWKKLFNEGYDNWLTVEEMNEMNRLFQQRHLLQHSEGIVDSKYIEKSKDFMYVEGQRVVVTTKDVLLLRNIIEKIALKIDEKMTI